MKSQILIRKKIVAQNAIEGMKIVRKKYPHSRIITYKFDKDFRFEDKKDYKNRTMKIVFVDDIRKIWD